MITLDEFEKIIVDTGIFSSWLIRHNIKNSAVLKPQLFEIIYAFYRNADIAYIRDDLLDNEEFLSKLSHELMIDKLSDNNRWK